jgi:hypothetical protein
MQDLASSGWHWPTGLANMATATNHGFPRKTGPGLEIQPASPTTRVPTPMHGHHELKPDDQGIWTGENGQIWPVVVLRDDMVPDMLRPTDPLEGRVPVLYFGTMDV